MPADPLDALRAPLVPLRPRAPLADALRRRLERLVREEGAVPTAAHKPPTRADVTTYLIVADCRRAIDWYREVFGAEVSYPPIVTDDGRIGHVEIRIGDTTLQLADEFPEQGIVGPDPDRRPPAALSVYVPDVDATYARAVDLGAVPDRPPADQFYGDRTGWLRDPFGHVWSIHTWLGEQRP